MPFCPQCRGEFREGFAHCARCDLPLVERPDPPPPAQEAVVMEDGEPLLLCSVSEGIKADLLMEALRTQNIPAMKQMRGAGQYLSVYMGFTVFGIDIYVPPRLHQKAREVAVGVLGPEAF